MFCCQHYVASENETCFNFFLYGFMSVFNFHRTPTEGTKCFEFHMDCPQASYQLKIPREHHRFILGKSGKKLQELELATATKITIPRAEENLDVIKISGTKEGIETARHEIECISEEQVSSAEQMECRGGGGGS